MINNIDYSKRNIIDEHKILDEADTKHILHEVNKSIY